MIVRGGRDEWRCLEVSSMNKKDVYDLVRKRSLEQKVWDRR